MRIIGLTAKAGAGKDLGGKLLIEALEEKGYTATILSFANPLKQVCALLFGWDYERLLNDTDYKEGDTLDDGSPDPACQLLGKTRRVVMQEVGTEAMRNGLHKDVWIIAMRLAIARGDFDEYDFGLLTDVRFLNELQFVRDLDGTLIKIERFGEQSTLTEHTQHASETEWEQWHDWDEVITNYIDPDLEEEENLMAFRTKLEDAIGWRDIPDRFTPLASPALRETLMSVVNEGIEMDAAEEIKARMKQTRNFRNMRSAFEGDPIDMEIDDPHWDGGDHEASGC